MPVRLRLARHGQKHAPVYHIVAINATKRRDARPLEKLGEYDPIPRIPKELANFPPKANVFGNQEYTVTKEKRIEWNVDRIRYWLGVGAQPTLSVIKLLERVSWDKTTKWKEAVADGQRAASLPPRTSGSTSGRHRPRALRLHLRPRPSRRIWTTTTTDDGRTDKRSL
jgi:small subunit ribosomal protein S16